MVPAICTAEKSDKISSFKAKRMISWRCWLAPSDCAGGSRYWTQIGLEEGAWGGVTAQKHTGEQPVCYLPGRLCMAALKWSQGQQFSTAANHWEYCYIIWLNWQIFIRTDKSVIYKRHEKARKHRELLRLYKNTGILQSVKLPFPHLLL